MKRGRSIFTGRSSHIVSELSLTLGEYIGRYDDADILAGQGTVGVEVIDQMKDIGEPLDAIVVPVGGGGLIAGVSVAMKQLSPGTEVIVS